MVAHNIAREEKRTKRRIRRGCRGGKTRVRNVSSWRPEGKLQSRIAKPRKSWLTTNINEWRKRERVEKSYFVLSFLLRISNLPRFKNKKIYPMLIRALFIRKEIEREISLFDLFLFFPHFFPPPSRRRRKRFRHIRAEFIVDDWTISRAGIKRV